MTHFKGLISEREARLRELSLEAKQLEREIATLQQRGRDRERALRDKDKCRCKHERRRHGKSFSINYTDGEWRRVMDYDCFSFTFWKPNKIQILRGDFEHGGVVFFVGEGKHKCIYSYGGGFDFGFDYLKK